MQTIVSPDKRNDNVNANTSDNKNDSASNTLPLEMLGTNQEVQRFVTPEKKRIKITMKLNIVWLIPYFSTKVNNIQ